MEVVDSEVGIVGVRLRVESQQLLADRIDQSVGATGYLVAVLPLLLAAIGGHGERIPIGIALKIDIGEHCAVRGSASAGDGPHVGVDDRGVKRHWVRGGSSYRYRASECVLREVAGAHIKVGHLSSRIEVAGYQTGKGDAVALGFLFAVQEEEGFALADGAAEGTAVLVEIEFFGFGGEEALGVERSVPQKSVLRPMTSFP